MGIKGGPSFNSSHTVPGPAPAGIGAPSPRPHEVSPRLGPEGRQRAAQSGLGKPPRSCLCLAGVWAIEAAYTGRTVAIDASMPAAQLLMHDLRWRLSVAEVSLSVLDHDQREQVGNVRRCLLATLAVMSPTSVRTRSNLHRYNNLTNEEGQDRSRSSCCVMPS